MRTPVSTAHQHLAGDAAAALSAAVAAARRRSHSQTTSLHVIYALLSTTSPSPPLLRAALSRTSPSRLQSEALDLCFAVALDRLPSSLHHHHHPTPHDDDPPVSNSLMAAIKRSQAHQRRNLDNSKVELQQLVIAILDDPMVSRVFGDAGFRSYDIKVAILRPAPPILRSPALFLCRDFPAASPRRFPFPLPDQLSADGGEENCRRIGEVLACQGGRNPVLVGAGAAEAAKDFVIAIENRNWSVLAPELEGMKFASVEREVLEIATGGGDGLVVGKRLEELGEKAEGKGVVVSIGDLKGLVEERLDCLVSEVTRVVEVHHGRLRLFGWAATYEVYMKFLSRYPLLDKAWDLQLLLITTVKPPLGGLLPRTPSIMDSFVPFGGFFPAACEPKGILGKSHQSAALCQHCNDNYDQELAAILRGCLPLVEDQHQTNVPAWLRKADMVSTNDELDSTKAKDARSITSSELIELQKKWNDNCQRLHQGGHICETQSLNQCGSALSMAMGVHITKSSQSNSLPSTSEPGDKDLISKLQARLSEDEELQDGSALSSSISSVATDLVLGSPREIPLKEKEKYLLMQVAIPSKEKEKYLLMQAAIPSKEKEKYLPMQAASPQCSGSSNMRQPFDLSNFKMFHTSLIEKVGRQEEALRSISEAIERCRAGQRKRPVARHRGDIWLGFIGHDQVGKKKAAIALAELIFGSRESFICIDLAKLNEYDMSFRGKTVIDHIAEEVGKNPCSVVVMENIDKADFLVQTSLSQAIHSGRLSDSYGREISIGNTVFVATAETFHGKTFPPEKECIFSEERILGAHGWQMKILLDSNAVFSGRNPSVNVSIASRQEAWNRQRNKRKHDSFLDLNLPLEEEASNSISDNAEAWVEEFFDLMDETALFRHFDFDALADYVVKEIGKSLRGVIGCEGVMEIDVKAMEQILAATWLMEDRGELNNWVEKVLVGGLMELKQRYDFSSRVVMRLVACEGVPMDRAKGILLPPRIGVE